MLDRVSRDLVAAELTPALDPPRGWEGQRAGQAQVTGPVCARRASGIGGQGVSTSLHSLAQTRGPRHLQ